MLTTVNILGVEILSVGTWHGEGCPSAGCEFTVKDLDTIVASHKATASVLAPPLKLGHDDDQRLLQTDGYPAAGWLANIRRVGQTLVADFMAVPKKIAELIDAGAYRTRSVELDGNVEIGGTKYGIVLTACALLGADLPAVQGLSDITALYAARQLELPKKVAVFSAPAKPPTVRFELPAGISYDDLNTRLRTAFLDAQPGADDDAWISETYEDRAIFNLEGRYWEQGYTVDAAGNVTLVGIPVEVQRHTEWRAVTASRNGRRYAEDAERVLADVTAFVARTAQLVELRAKDGRTISKRNRERIEALHDGVAEAAADLAAFLSKAPPTPNMDGALYAARARQARSRLSELQEA